MLAANEAVAEHLAGLKRAVPAPRPSRPRTRSRLEAFADFARSLGYKIDANTDRFALQRILQPVGRRARHVRGPLRPAAQSETGALQPRRGGPLRPGQRRLTATSPRRFAAIPI